MLMVDLVFTQHKTSIKDMNFQLLYFIFPLRELMQYSSSASSRHLVSTTVATHHDELSSER